MWFASIWIFTLKLPWQHGASFFMKHLFDADSASNTLSWRWVAGMHTNKKPYLASRENINKYTLNRFKNFSINLAKEINLSKNINHKPNKIEVQKIFPSSNILIMFDNDMCIYNRDVLFNSYSKIYIIFNGNIESNYKLSKNVRIFKNNLIKNINKLIQNSEIFNSKDLGILLHGVKYIDVIYPGVGNNLDLINKFSYKRKINVNFIYRSEDINYWNHDNSGFYKFKNAICKINMVY